MYVESAMPAGGFCLLDESDGSCILKKGVKYECIGDETEGKWQESGTGDMAYVDNTTLALKEVGCKADDLTMDGALETQPGRLITCSINEYVDGANNIQAENDCIMLCDMYPIFSFYTDFKVSEEGRGWFYETFDNPGSPGELVPGMLDCWGKR